MPAVWLGANLLMHVCLLNQACHTLGAHQEGGGGGDQAAAGADVQEGVPRLQVQRLQARRVHVRRRHVEAHRVQAHLHTRTQGCPAGQRTIYVLEPRDDPYWLLNELPHVMYHACSRGGFVNTVNSRGTGSVTSIVTQR